MPSIISGSLMRATPPSRRMSAGTRSSAMTAHGAGVLGDLGLLGGDDVHDDAALQHLGEAPLDAGRCRCCDSSVMPHSRTFVRPIRRGAGSAALAVLRSDTCERDRSVSTAIAVGAVRSRCCRA